MKRFVVWVVRILLILVIAGVSASEFSPWPAVSIVRLVFWIGDRTSEAALEKHVPAGIITRRNIAYGKGQDEILDLYYSQNTRDTQPAIVWVHGGGFVAGSKEGVANYMKVLAAHGFTVAAVEYSRGHGSTYPKPVEQVNTALGFVIRNAADLRIDPATIILAGDSAGAQIASQVALITTDPVYSSMVGISPQIEAKRLAAMLLVSGVYDPPSLDFEGVYGWFLRAVAWEYSGTKNFRADKRFRQMSVTNHVTEAFPPTFISSGHGDPLAPQAVAFAHRLSELGVLIDPLFFPADHHPSLRHEYQFNLDGPDGQEALRRILSFLDSIRSRAQS